MKSGNMHGVERIFNGKRKFHKSMANLPIKEKLKMVAVLQRIDYSIKAGGVEKTHDVAV